MGPGTCKHAVRVDFTPWQYPKGTRFILLGTRNLLKALLCLGASNAPVCITCFSWSSPEPCDAKTPLCGPTTELTFKECFCLPLGESSVLHTVPSAVPAFSASELRGHMPLTWKVTLSGILFSLLMRPPHCYFCFLSFNYRFLAKKSTISSSKLSYPGSGGILQPILFFKCHF